ncbi:MAG: hypothetical protein MUF21_06415 [Gemmatimonadaceae bacterium]|nr:hypothetical protein [Gemmatimonadaceae bacterium]
MAACRSEPSTAERVAAVLNEEASFREDSAAIMARVTTDTVFTVWGGRNPEWVDTIADTAAVPPTLFRFQSRSGYCWATTKRASAGDTLTCPWEPTDQATYDAGGLTLLETAPIPSPLEDTIVPAAPPPRP